LPGPATHVKRDKRTKPLTTLAASATVVVLMRAANAFVTKPILAFAARFHLR